MDKIKWERIDGVLNILDETGQWEPATKPETLLIEAIEDFIISDKAKIEALEHKLDLAWGIIANAGGGNWKNETKEWQEAATKWSASHYGNPEALKKLEEK